MSKRYKAKRRLFRINGERNRMRQRFYKYLGKQIATAVGIQLSALYQDCAVRFTYYRRNVPLPHPTGQDWREVLRQKALELSEIERLSKD